MAYWVNGGEYIPYYEKGEKKMIADIYHELKLQRKEKKEGVEYHD